MHLRMHTEFRGGCQCDFQCTNRLIATLKKPFRTLATTLTTTLKTTLIITTTLTYASQMRAVPSFDAVTTRAPSGEKAQQLT